MKGAGRDVTLGGRTVAVHFAVHHSGAGPGILLLADEAGLDAGLVARAELLAEEGYAVLALDLGPGGTTEEVARAADALRAMPEHDGKLAAVGHGGGGTLACRAAAAAGLDAIVAFDAAALAERPKDVTALPCPVTIQLGTKGDARAVRAAEALGAAADRRNGSAAFAYPDAAPGFAIPGRPGFDKRIDGLAHSRTLELLRRVMGPYYDYVRLFAEHVRHEFETRDVDATMATMIEEPYVNHVPTLAGGVGHDMLKRFYKYHFVEQNSRERSSVTVSQTLGPDRLVLETVARFRHDQVLDRYFPNIAPTGRMVEIPLVLIVRFRGDRVCHEHIYWDQGSALAQIGAIDAAGLPIAGPEAARKVLDETLPSNPFMQEAWATSEGKPI